MSRLNGYYICVVGDRLGIYRRGRCLSITADGDGAERLTHRMNARRDLIRARSARWVPAGIGRVGDDTLTADRIAMICRVAELTR